MGEPDDPALDAPAPDSAVSRLVRPRSLTQLVVDQIRDLIVTGRLALGEQLSENALADRLGVSRTPVREAFLRLETERLVEIRPQRGTFVFACGQAEVRDICELREILEAGALRLAIGRDRASLHGALSRNVAAAEAAHVKTSAEYQPFDHEFHQIIIGGCGNRQLTEAYDQIAGRVRALRYRLIRTLDQVAGSQSAHGEIARCVGAGDDAGAEAALRHHVYSSYRSLLMLFEEGQPFAGGHR
jgi:DNA-binding GntR family transcriptional regulator